MICVVVKQRSCWLVWRAGDIYRPGQSRPAPPVSLLSYQQRAVRLRRYKKQTGWESWHCWSSLHSVNMRQFVSVQYFHCPVSSLSPLTGCRPLLGCRQPGCPAAQVLAKPYINTGSASGPLTPAVGDLVATPKGYRSLALEGFSEDLNQDGFVVC